MNDKLSRCDAWSQEDLLKLVASAVREENGKEKNNGPINPLKGNTQE